MFWRNATVLSTPPAAATDPMNTVASAKNISVPWMRSVVHTDR